MVMGGRGRGGGRRAAGNIVMGIHELVIRRRRGVVMGEEGVEPRASSWRFESPCHGGTTTTWLLEEG